MRIIDLTLPLRPGMRGVEIETCYTLERDGWNARLFRLYSHAGTHMDAPTHFGAGSETIENIPLDRCSGPAWVVNLAPIQPRALISIDHLGEVTAKLQPGDSLLLRTDWSRFVDVPSIYRDQLPRISPELAEWLVEKNVKMLGVEPPSVADVNALPELTRVHQILLRGGVVIVEGLAYLENLKQDKILFHAFPLKIENGDGSPCRAFAIENH